MEHWTEKYLGIPFKVQGRTLQGLDCWGLFCLIYKERYNIELPSYINDYEDIKDLSLLKKLYSEGIQKAEIDWIEIPHGQEQEGDGLLMPLVGIATHAALVIQPRMMIHISEGINVTIEPYKELKWAQIYKRSRIYRHPEVALAKA